ncbi:MULTISPECIES: phosphoribosylanthranilate isomerase [unclassified Clostridium]|uniref:phosphoribosylanthranilate isomerase n=1 Tax=unclassified Clostridium TaxID=2614128 RepID=UPI0002981721|nr:MULTISPECIES: phosphoribosylanthranilate isomerase [unclassified Clostridium]EKQ58278.1 MAG: phosphoribosylanthranilate isomerase [Clostridium sp. Maddingley MBC34-26]
MIQIKICGITNGNEIEYINALKPEYIGFVFTKSKRQVTGAKAKELCSKLNKEIKTVGVFKDNSMEEILDVLEVVYLDAVQLHGKEDETFIIELKKKMNGSIEVWKALSISNIENIKKYIPNKDNSLIDNLLIDGDNPGSGEIFSLEDISKLFKENSKLEGRFSNQYNFFLAGGITPENVIERVKKANPIGVDVSSGVEVVDESGNRTKSFDKMKDFIENVRKI